MDGTILGQGTFSASYSGTNPNPGVASVQAGNQVIIQIPSAADWVKVYNLRQYGTAGINTAYFQGTGNAVVGREFYWQRGMVAGTALVKYYGNGGQVFSGDVITTGGFTIYDPSGLQTGSRPLLGNPVATTASTDAIQPVVSTASTAGLSIGSVVRLSNTAQTDVNGIDFVVGAVVANTSFTLLTASNRLANAPGIAGGAGFYRIVYNPPLFYPARKTVVNITQAVNAQVSTATEHSLTVGQAIRFNIPNLGTTPSTTSMIQLNPTPLNNYLVATVLTVVDPYNFTININTVNFNPFIWPLYTNEPTGAPSYEPIGENSAVALAANNSLYPQYQGQNIFNANNGVFADATINTGFYGMILGSGGNGAVLGTPIIGPAGTVHFTSGDVIDTTDNILWVSGKAEFGGL